MKLKIKRGDNMKKGVRVALIVGGVILGAIALLVIIAYIPWLMVLFVYFFGENPEKPEIRYGEFDYSLVYELNGETKTINDTLVCEYDGISYNLDGKSVAWKSYIKGTKEQDNYVIFENDEYRLYIYVPSDARYYMDDPVYELYGLDADVGPWFVYEHVNDGAEVEYQMYSVEEYEEKFGAKIVSWEIEDPIENTYKK
jgi:hypothetical protein